MKKITSTFLSFLIFCFIFIFLTGLCETVLSHYYRQGKVVEINQEFITIEDRSGNLWEVAAVGFQPGQTVRMTMYDNHSSDISTHEVVALKKIENFNP